MWMAYILHAILRTLLKAPTCPWTGEPCPTPQRCGFFLTHTACRRDTIERNL